MDASFWCCLESMKFQVNILPVLVFIKFKKVVRCRNSEYKFLKMV